MVVHVFDIYLIIVYEKSHPTSCYKMLFRNYLNLCWHLTLCFATFWLNASLKRIAWFLSVVFSWQIFKWQTCTLCNPRLILPIHQKHLIPIQMLTYSNTKKSKSSKQTGIDATVAYNSHNTIFYSNHKVPWIICFIKIIWIYTPLRDHKFWSPMLWENVRTKFKP